MAQPSTIDLLTPFDPTAYTSISGAQLEQLVAGSTPYSDKGMIVVSSDVGVDPEVPNANTTTKWKNYIWIRRQSASIGVYVWNDASALDVTYLKWKSITISGIGTDAILTNMIKDFNVTDAKIVSLDASKLIGTLSPTVSAGVVTTSTPFVGDVTGLYNANTITASAVTTSKIADSSVTNAKLINAATSVSGIDITTKVKCSVTGLQQVRTNAGATALEYFTPKSFESSAVTVTTGNAGKIPRVATAGTADNGTWEMVAPTGANSFGLVRQRYFVKLTSNELGVSGTAPTPYKISDFLKTGVSGFVPISSANIIAIKLSGIGITNSTADNNNVEVWADYTGGNATFTQKLVKTSLDGNKTGFVIASGIAEILNQTTRIDVQVRFEAGTYTPTLQAGTYLEIIEYASA